MHTLLRYGDTIDPRNEQGVVIFHHIPKCAGTSFVELLMKADGRFMSMYSVGDYLRLKNLPPGRWILAGHEIWGCHAQLPGDRWIAYITFLRNPLRIFLSLFKFTRAKGLLSPNVDIENFLLNNYSHNHLVSWLGAGDLELAKDRLVNTFMHLGIVEEFASSLQLMASDIGLNYTDVPHSNVSHASSESFPQHLQDYFWELNNLDLELYEWAVGVFRQRRIEAEIPQADIAVLQPAQTFSKKEAIAAWAAKDIALAIQELTDKSAQLDDADYEALATLYKCAGDFEKMRQTYETGNTFYSMKFDLQLAKTLIALGRASEAAELMRTHETRLKPIAFGFPDAAILTQRSSALQILAHAQFAQGLRHQAMDSIREAAALETFGYRERLGMIRWLCDHGEFDVAEELLQRVPEPQGSSDKAAKLSMTGRILMAQGKSEEAMALHEKALALVHMNMQILQESVVSARKASRHAWAIALLRAFREQVSSSDLLYVAGRELATTLFEVGETAAALDVFSSLASKAQDDELASLAAFADTGSREKLSLARCLGHKGRILLVRASQWVHCFHFVEMLRALAPGRVDLLTAFPVCLPADTLSQFSMVWPLPSGHYVAAHELPKLDPALFTEEYDAVVILTSFPDPAQYENILRLVRQISCTEKYMHSVAQATSIGFKQLLLPV